MNFKYECLLMINKKNQSALFNLCDDNKSFLKILEKEKIQKKSNKLIFNEIEYDYILETNLIAEKEERYFHFKVVCKNAEKKEDLEHYIKFLKELRIIFNKNNFGLEILRDDLPLHYSEEAYVLINKLENHMRKFIKYFLITKVGINWIEETTPKEIEKAIEDKKDRDKEDKLKRLDFSELGNFLFYPYSKRNSTELQKLINEKKITDLTILQEFVQESNWEKYFKENIKCDNDYLKSKWDNLYKYRNNIAHNKDFNNSNLEEVKKLCKEVNEKLKEAFDGIDEIKNTDIDKVEVKNIFNSLISNSSLYENEITRKLAYATSLGFANTSTEYEKLIATINSSIIPNPSVNYEQAIANVTSILGDSLYENEITRAIIKNGFTHADSSILAKTSINYEQAIANVTSILGNPSYENEAAKAVLGLNDYKKKLKK